VLSDHVKASGEGRPARRRLDEVVQGCCQPSEAEQVSARLGLALGFSGEGRESRRYRAAEIRSGFLAFVAGMSKGNPVVLVFDDLHHARPALFDYAARRLAARPEVRATMGLVMGDLVPASRALDPRYLASLLAP